MTNSFTYLDSLKSVEKKLANIERELSQIFYEEADSEFKHDLGVVVDNLVMVLTDDENLINMIDNKENETSIKTYMSYLVVSMENAVSCAKHIRQDYILKGKVQKIFTDHSNEMKGIHKKLLQIQKIIGTNG